MVMMLIAPASVILKGKNRKLTRIKGLKCGWMRVGMDEQYSLIVCRFTSVSDATDGSSCDSIGKTIFRNNITLLLLTTLRNKGSRSSSNLCHYSVLHSGFKHQFMDQE